MFLRFIVLLVASSVPAPSLALTRQPAQDVSLCDLMHHPKSYDGQMIRVRGHVIFEFENFTLYDPTCHSESTSPAHDEKGVWLTFGGDEPEIATYCCGDPQRKKGTDLEVAGHKVGLNRDVEFYRFLHQLEAQRLRRPDGKECGAECKFYEVTATVTGLFAASSAKGGYGHFGMFHLLAISRVSQVIAERRPVPFGGAFACSAETWEPKAEDSSVLDRALRCTDATDSCTSDQRFGPVAAHWNDDLNGGSETEAYTDMHGDQIANWVSADLRTSYFAKTTTEHFSITREHCHPVSPDRGSIPSSRSIACDHYRQSLDDAIAADVEELLAKSDFPSAWARTAEGARRLFRAGDQSWRSGEAKSAAWHVLQEQSRQWRLPVDPNLQFDACQDSSMDETPIFVGCSWYSQDGTQTFDVSLLKERRSAAQPGNSPWLITSVNAQSCHPTE